MEDPCLSCGATDYTSYVKQHVQLEEGKPRELRAIKCNRCENAIKADYFTDAGGNRITMTQQQRYSYALGGPILNKKQFSEQLKRLNLVQTGTGKVKGYNIKESK